MSEHVVKTTCKSCHGGCRVLVKVKSGKIVHIEGDPSSLTRGTMCPKGLASIKEVYNPSRLKYPLKRVGERGEGEWKRISWKEALDTIAEKMKEYIEEYGPSSILIGQGTGRGYNRYTFRFARSIGSPNVLLPAHFCYAPRLAAFGITVGGRLYCDYHGWGGEYPKTIVHWGKQLEYTNADGEMAVWFLRALEEAEHFILVDPKATPVAHRADLWLPVRPGTDAALALGMLNVIISEELYDKDFVEQWTHGFDRLRERVEEYSPDKVSRITWVPEDKIKLAAEWFATSRPGCIQIGQALEAGNNSIQTLRAIICLMAVTGNIERPGGMVNWVPPETGEMEEFALEVPPPEELPIGADRYKLLALPPFAMCHFESVCEDLLNGERRIKMMHLQGTNPVLAYANSKDVLKALLNVEFISVVDLYMSPTAKYADIVLPAAHWLETDDIYDMHPRFFVSAIVRAVEPVGEALPDNVIFNELGKRLAPKYWFSDVYEMLNYQLRKAGITWEEFKEIGVLARTGKEHYYKYKTNYWREGGGFPTPTGKIELYSTILENLNYDPLPYYREPNESPYSTPELSEKYPLILSTGGRVPYYFHSQYRQNPWLRELQPDPVALIHPETAEKYGIKDGDWIWIETPRGRIRQRARLFEAMNPRYVFAQASWYYPEKPDLGIFESNANVLTSNKPPFDPCIGSTTFRAMLCRIYRCDGGE
ncbi:Anaerobic dehydrogenase, typically selenocysteine-containing [Archaeoglobus fulgidus DSM 8774]|uniref:Anaerobic dehydrogenase, typically selenocysteine-containing n=1 Tax=Archaeoglobus fulgidus DSM 8774 TaxID=1344584 RepID=A0A075WEE4_ARCFL|nr:molybdopterin-dependent oxidoreductase [Archaeoglobus fulgidus]AIG98077.1 Anaerobic dehydrogenase, typically selenocysteine-containing [Archaeoglobus fulgidus DSM 8774]